MSELQSLLVRQLFFWNDWSMLEIAIAWFFICGMLDRKLTRHDRASGVTALVWLLISGIPCSFVTPMWPKDANPNNIVIAFLFRIIYCQIVATKSAFAVRNLLDVYTGVSNSTEQCSICLEDHNKSSVKLKACNHIYHEKCIDTWLDSHKSNQTCPLCRAKV